MNELRDRVVLITGASSGIGAATAVACGAAGMRVALAARREELLREVAERVTAAGAEVWTYRMDVVDPEQVEALAAAAVARFGRMDVLLANAGVGYSGPLAETTDAELVQVVTVNLLGVMRCARAVLPHMIAQGSGHIITVSSVAAVIAMTRAEVYAATKAGVHRFAEGLRREARPHGVHLTDVLPGIYETAMTERTRGFPKLPVERLAREIVGVIRRPRRTLVSPAWYRPVLALNHVAPALVDTLIARLEARWR